MQWQVHTLVPACVPQSALLLEARRQLSSSRVDLETQLSAAQDELKKANSQVSSLKAESASLVRGGGRRR
jgi:hypothetical protein